MDNYEKQMTGYLILTILGGLFVVIEAVVIELQVKLYWIVFIGVFLGATEVYLTAILIHIFKLPLETLLEEIKTTIPESEPEPEEVKVIA